MKLPERHEPYTDKYFLRTNQILKAEGLNPEISMKVFARGEGKVAGLEEAVAILDKFTDLRQTGKVWVTKETEFKTKDPLMVIKGPAQSFIELETLYLGVLSTAISEANGVEPVDETKVREKLQRLTQIYQDKPIMYFGARHYHWSLDETIGRAALEGGAVTASTDIAAQHVGKEGAGTTPHALTLILALRYGRENATRMTAELFDKHIDKSVPRVTLVDTFNEEIWDALEVAQYFGKRKNWQRIDTCGENVGQHGTPHPKGRDPTYQTGTGVTIELARNIRETMILNGLANYTGTILTSGMGDEDKAKAFMQADAEFKERTGYNLFDSVGVGEVSKAMFTTADIYEINGMPFSKVGREVDSIDFSKMRKVLGE